MVARWRVHSPGGSSYDDSHVFVPIIAGAWSLTQTRYIDSSAALAEAVSQCRSVAVVALDTEFIRTDTFYPLPALIQVFDASTVFLIDPVAIDDLEPLKALLADDSVIKVMHSCSEDMDVFARLLDVVPTPLVDTQIAASLAGLDFSISYQRLVEQLLNQPLEKGETRSDWLQRPLSEKQLQYAADDVLWLLEVYQSLMERLAQQQRSSWLEEESRRLLEDAHNPPPLEEYYLRIKSAWRLSGQSLVLLQMLCLWRERLAREHNVPRGRIASDSALYEIARSRPKDKSQLSRVKALKPANIRQYGSQLLAIANQQFEDETHSVLNVARANDAKALKDAIKHSKRLIARVAEEQSLPVEIVGRNRDVEQFLFAAERQRTLLGSGWRASLLGDSLTAIADRYNQEQG